MHTGHTSLISVLLLDSLCVTLHAIATASSTSASAGKKRKIVLTIEGKLKICDVVGH